MIKKTSFKDQIYQYLKQAIVKGELTHGEIYSEQMFADQLQVSRTPVREAVLQLKNEDFVEIYNNRGFGIKAISLEVVQQILQARRAIEGYSIRYLAEHIASDAGQQALVQLEACLVATEKLAKNDTDHYEYMQADIEFHGIIVRFTQNIYLIRMVEQMRTRLEQATVNSLTLKNRHKDALDEHRKILKYITSGDVANAEKAFNEHMAITENILKRKTLI